MSIAATEKDLLDEFELLGNDWEARYEHIISMGKDMPPLRDEEKKEEFLIKGCQSRVWLLSEFRNGKVFFKADSDAAIPKGIVAMMVRLLSGNTPDEIVNAPLNVVNSIGLKEHLSPTRANGLVSMIKQMKLDALAYKAKV
ncbi:MAG: SufE family protein [Bacteroidia bacterium]|nr:SufE family protein [Bacteroidia bacterium]